MFQLDYANQESVLMTISIVWSKWCYQVFLLSCVNCQQIAIAISYISSHCGTVSWQPTVACNVTAGMY